MAFDRNEWNVNYKKDHFDNISFFAPKGTKDKVKACATAKHQTVSEYMRNLVEDAIKKDTP